MAVDLHLHQCEYIFAQKMLLVPHYKIKLPEAVQGSQALTATQMLVPPLEPATMSLSS